jgi:hypothetical protein
MSYHSRTVRHINRIPNLAFCSLLQVFSEGRKVRKCSKVILLKDHKVPYGPGQTLEYSIVELQIPHDEQAAKFKTRKHPYGDVQPKLVDILLSNIREI